MDPNPAPCEFCSSPGGPVVWQNDVCRVVRVDEPDYPGFCRVILNRHARELTDLGPEERDELMRVVYAVEAAIRGTLGADKMNVASLGNMTPHVHWHVVPRFVDDRHYPSPIWAAPRRDSVPHPEREAAAAQLAARLRERLGS